MSEEIKTPQNNSEEVDLGQLFKLIGNMFDRFFRFVGQLFNKVFLAFIWCVFFVKKHFIKLVITAVLGFAFGFFKEKTSDSVFKASVIIKQNYQTGENLYNTINYYNVLLSQLDYKALAEKLSVDTTRINSITSFGVEALISENERLVVYNNYTKKLDSNLVSSLDFDYKDYLANVKEGIYQFQKLTISSKSNDNFVNVFEGIINNLNSNTYFKREQEKDLVQLENRKLAVLNSLAQSDSLQKTYKKVLENTIETATGAQTSITIDGGDEKNQTREFELYINDIELRKELVTIDREKENKQFIVEILSNTPNRGFIDTSVKVLDKSFSSKLFYAVFFTFILFLILLMIRFLKYLEKFKQDVS